MGSKIYRSAYIQTSKHFLLLTDAIVKELEGDAPMHLSVTVQRSSFNLCRLFGFSIFGTNPKHQRGLQQDNSKLLCERPRWSGRNPLGVIRGQVINAAMINEPLTNQSIRLLLEYSML